MYVEWRMYRKACVSVMCVAWLNALDGCARARVCVWGGCVCVCAYPYVCVLSIVELKVLGIPLISCRTFCVGCVFCTGGGDGYVYCRAYVLGVCVVWMNMLDTCFVDPNVLLLYI